jgi:cellobiose phosphorylase
MGFKGETVLVAFQVRHGLAVYADVARRLDLADEAAWADRERAALDGNLQRHAWDGAWFVRAFKDTGEKIGAACCEEGKIYHLVQSWAVMSGAATPEQARTAMDSVDRLLQTEHGCVCQAPAYRRAECKELRMVLMHPGEKENGGVFSHPQGWVVIANCLLGNGDRAWRAHRANLPARFNDLAEIRRIEPYCYCQSTSGRESDRAGMSHIPWLTGAASWSHYAATRHLLGLQAEIDGFRIDPCIPAAWPGFTARRVFRGCALEIEVRNPHGRCKGVRRLVVDGKPVDGNFVPLAMLKPITRISAEIAR